MVAAFVLVIWFCVLAVEYWFASRHLDTTNAELDRLEVALAEPIKSVNAIEEAKAASEQDLVNWSGKFQYEGYPETDYLLAIVSVTAQEASVGLSSMVVADEDEIVLEGVRYFTQQLRLIVIGPSHAAIYDFLDLLYMKLPFMSIANIELGGFTDSPTADITLVLYLDPQSAVESK